MKNKNIKKTIVFRCDASSDIGWGHMIRDLAIVKELNSVRDSGDKTKRKKEYISNGVEKNNQIIFASIKDRANSEIKKRNFKIFFKKKKEREGEFLKRIKNVLAPEIIVIDRKYPYKLADLSPLKKAGIKVVIIDKFCKGARIADEIIFPNAHLDKKLLKKFLPVKKIKKVRFGFEYLVLRKEILKLKSRLNDSFQNRPNIVLTTGGTDPKGILLKLISWLRGMNLDAGITALFGKSFSFPEKLKKIRKNLPSNFQVLPYSLKEIRKADIVICTFGMSIYEMIYLGIPAISISHNIENTRGAKILKERCGVIEDMGYIGNLKPQKIYQALVKLVSDKDYYKNYKRRVVKYGKLIDGKGACRVADIIAA